VLDEADQPLRVSRRVNAQAATIGFSRVNKNRAVSRSETDCDWVRRLPRLTLWWKRGERGPAWPGDRGRCEQPPGGCHLGDKAQTQPHKAHDLLRAGAERINVGVRRAGEL
jgi:hypothetical protein